MKKAIPSQAEYELNERGLFNAQIAAVEKSPLPDRKEGEKDFREALEIPGRMAERAEWILNGSYGFGAQLIAREVAANRRMNRAAWFGQVIAALDHGCPQAFAARAWLALPKMRQAQVNAEIIQAIEAGKE